MVLYSVNVYLKLFVQRQYYGDIHYVWCSEHYDSTKLSSYSPGFLVPATSNPADIYQDLKSALSRGDTHNYKITEQRASIRKHAIDSCIAGKITEDQRDEIISLSDLPLNEMWRPIVYVIPRVAVESRLEVVPLAKRAGVGIEYIIKDLKRSEFDIIEP